MFCPKCGSKIDEGVRFCPKCGNEIILQQKKTQENSNQNSNMNSGQNPDKIKNIMKIIGIVVVTIFLVLIALFNVLTGGSNLELLVGIGVFSFSVFLIEWERKNRDK